MISYCAKCEKPIQINTDCDINDLLDLGYDVWGINEDQSFYITCRECTDECFDVGTKEPKKEIRVEKITYQELSPL